MFIMFGITKWCGNASTHGGHSYAFGTGSAWCPGWTARNNQR